MITDEFYKDKKTEFQDELDELELRHNNFISEMDNLVDMATQIIELCKTLIITIYGQTMKINGYS